MIHFEVDPDSLIAAGKVADRQHTHLSRVQGYVGDVCSDTGAFSGVLQIFVDSYQSTLEHARLGLTNSCTVAEKVQEAFIRTSELYVESDHASYLTFHRLFGDEMALPPYVAPGGGSSTPGGPHREPGSGEGVLNDAGLGTGADDGVKLPKLPPWLNDPLDRTVPGEKQELPAWVDPKAALKDKVLLTLRTRADYDDYLALRAQGYSPEQAQDLVRPDVQGLADQHVHDRMQARQQAAHDHAYDQAILNGESPDDARTAAQNAAQDQSHHDATDHQRRQDVLDTGGTYKGAYDQVSSLVNNVQNIDQHVDAINEAQEDIEDYDDYETQDDDRSAQNWAR